MWHHHELGQGWTAKQRMVGTADVHHLKPDGLAATVSFLPEENLQLHPAKRGA
jgi:hypothetical protein